MSAGAENWAAWVGKRDAATDFVAPSQVEGMHVTLDRDGPPPRIGDPLPPLWHWMFFSAKAPASKIGPDGHPERGDYLPPIPLPRRMFAGARAHFHRPLRVGEAITRDSEIIGVELKQGRSGNLAFVHVRHAISGENGLAIEQDDDIVYREVTAPAQTPRKDVPENWSPDWSREITPDPVMLFRYSALTFNGHRIHYDHPYVTQVEGYPALIVQGPLIATWLAVACLDALSNRKLAAYGFRALRPLFATAPFMVTGKMNADGEGCTLRAIDPDGAIAMEADACFA